MGTQAANHRIYDEIRAEMVQELWWPADKFLTFAACVLATASQHARNPGEYGRRIS